MSDKTRLAECIKDAERIIGKALRMCKNPVIGFSGGKDSMVLTHIMTRRLNLEIPVVFHREPFQVHKYAFGMRVLADWKLTAFDYPPASRSMWLGKGILAWTNHYQIGRMPDGRVVTLDLPKNIVRDDSEDAMCGLEHFIQTPTGLFNYPWDMFFVGQKNTDEDQIAGKTPLTCDISQNRIGPSGVFPLRHWTDDDIWLYIKTEKLPVDSDRYDYDLEKERESKAWNSDYFAACTRCIDKREGDVVTCPKTGLEISNVSAQVPYRQPFHKNQMSAT